VDETLGEEKIMQVLGIDVRNAPPIADYFN
jgi:hypothetical protein